MGSTVCAMEFNLNGVNGGKVQAGPSPLPGVGGGANFMFITHAHGICSEGEV